MVGYDKAILLRIKALAERSIEMAEERTQVSATVSVVLIHESVEWVLRYITQDWLAKEIEGVLKSYWDKFRENQNALSELDKWDAYIDRLRLARNTVLHRAIISESDTPTLCLDGTELIKSLMNSVLGVKYDELSYSSLLRNKEFKEWAVDAETSFQNGKYAECIERSKSLVWAIIYELSGAAGELSKSVSSGLACTSRWV